MSTSGDRDKVIETALSLGRKVEVFPAEESNIEVVQTRVRKAFDIAWNVGLFKVSRHTTFFHGLSVKTTFFAPVCRRPLLRSVFLCAF